MFINIKNLSLSIALLLTVAVGAFPASTFASGYGGPYNFGTAASAADIALLDIDAMPDGRGLPKGSSNYEKGKPVYVAKCAACHGVDLGV